MTQVADVRHGLRGPGVKNGRVHGALQPRTRTARPPAGDGGAAALPGFFYRLAPRDQKAYLRSEATDAYDLAAGVNAAALAEALVAALDSGGSLASTGRAAQALVTELCRSAGVRAVPIEVKGARPRNARGELHGIFYPDAPRIVLWTRTAIRGDVVKPRTFVRTLMHELAHYLDYALLRLGNSYHTRGFFKRESFLVRAVLPSFDGEHQ